MIINIDNNEKLFPDKYIKVDVNAELAVLLPQSTSSNSDFSNNAFINI